jgi:hypothetical protein
MSEATDSRLDPTTVLIDHLCREGALRDLLGSKDSDMGCSVRSFNEQRRRCHTIAARPIAS